MTQVTDPAAMIRRRHLAGRFPDAYRRALLARGADPALFIPPAPRRTWFEVADTHIETIRGVRGLDSRDARARQAAASWWFKSQRKRLATGAMTDEQAAHLDTRAPGWRDPANNDWHTTADTHIHLMQALGRRPSLSRPHEARSAQWFALQRRLLKRGELAPERIAHLDEHAPGWRPGDGGDR